MNSHRVTMFVILLLLSVAAMVSAHGDCHNFLCHNHHNYHHDHNHGNHNNFEDFHDQLFSQLARDVKALDEKVKRSCNMHSNELTREVIGSNRYMLATPLPGYTDSDFNIRVKGRAIYIKAKTNSGNNHYGEMRTLPTFVDAAKAMYGYVDGTLKIIFPTNIDANSCNYSYNDSIITVPKYQLTGVGPRSDFANSMFDELVPTIYK